ncbi:hypothetical protein Peur_046314 [Populus x canadensis]
MPTSWSTFPVNYREICLGFHYLYQQDNHRPKITDTGTQGFTSAPASIGFKSLQRSCMERKERCMEKLHAIFTRSWGKK